MARKITITGCLQGAECDHCGRKLKYGIQTDAGTMGADCLSAMVPFDRKRWGNGRPGGSYLRDLAMTAERGNRSRLPAHAFTLDIKE